MPGAELSRDDVVSPWMDPVARYQRPRRIEFVDKLPRDCNNKIQRRVLAQRDTTPEQMAE